MLNRITLFVLCYVLLISCQKPIQQPKEPSVIDRKKIDAVFRKDVSKVLLDHLYVVVDSITYAKLTKDNEWKDTYATMDLGLPDFAPVTNYSSTCYLRGHQHYIEILGPKNKYNEPIGKSGIGFSLKNDDEHFHLGVEPKFKVTKDSFLYAAETVEMPLGEHKHTWFKAFYTPSPGTALHTWYGFYNPAFLESLYGKQYTSYSREAFLKSTYADQKLFNGIKEIYLNCIPNDYRRIVQELRYLGCKFLEQNDNVLTIAGGDVKINIGYSNNIEYSRITKIVCRLNNMNDGITQLGNLTISNKGTKSIWNFDELYKNNP
ncbi:DUF5829 family protein [Aquimarina algiphila]|uniref:Uncharacterized protein n=1 Tax=Aquimarina algiphila TaxID=2047982 RepID=A0A554VJM7_9FLAO|nr:DUF5829 family protein [Aquimarina algiphila]TSE08109.1 hypothetical protein FOF46_13715 [Aquimarina algiphila]